MGRRQMPGDMGRGLIHPVTQVQAEAYLAQGCRPFQAGGCCIDRIAAEDGQMGDFTGGHAGGQMR